MTIALLFWAASIIFVIAIAAILCQKIEASKVQRWGATGRFFSYEQKEGHD